MLAVSVIIPTFNGAQFIGRTLDSILQQDYPPSEIIVVNDGSTDDTASVVRTYAPGVRLIDIENGGPTGARLTAVRAAKSEWLAFCDSDDLWHPDHLSGLVGLADTHSVLFAFSNFRHVKNGQRADKSHFEADPNFWMQPGRPVGNDGFIAEAPLFLRVLSHQAVFPSCILVHRAFFDRVGGLKSCARAKCQRGSRIYLALHQGKADRHHCASDGRCAASRAELHGRLDPDGSRVDRDIGLRPYQS